LDHRVDSPPPRERNAEPVAHAATDGHLVRERGDRIFRPLAFARTAQVGSIDRARAVGDRSARHVIAIVLGLLTTSVKAGFDTAYNARGHYAGELAQMDRCLRDYGPETAPIRQQLRAYVAAVIASTWPNEPPPANVSYPNASKMARTGENPILASLMNDVGLKTRSLLPADPVHQSLMAACVQDYHDLIEARWAVIEGLRQSISTPFYWVLVFWLAILFGSFGLTAAPNPMIATVIALCALSVSAAVLVIKDLDEPYGGLFGIPSASMRDALADMTR
jgi:hypothetical protein